MIDARIDSNSYFNNWYHNMVHSFNRGINKVGYARAAAELARWGYHKEARQCYDQYERL